MVDAPRDTVFAWYGPAGYLRAAHTAVGTMRLVAEATFT